jgi:hypothetical protein
MLGIDVASRVSTEAKKMFLMRRSKPNQTYLKFADFSKVIKFFLVVETVIEFHLMKMKTIIVQIKLPLRRNPD